MRTAFQSAKRVVIVAYLIALHVALLYLIGDRVVRRYTIIQPVDNAAVPAPNGAQRIPTPLPVPETFADTNTGSPVANADPGSAPDLMIPVLGVTPDQLSDTFSDSRSDGRFHDAIDIPAPAGTPVVAAADGEIARFYDSERGGITIYQFSADRRFVFYYAHLQRRVDEVWPGMKVRKGATIGYVGDTGNAGAGNYHLHFAISQVTDPNRLQEGIAINPYPLLKAGLHPRAP